MLNRLHWQLSLLYVLAAATLIALIGGGAYRLLAYSFETSTDLALQAKVALEYAKIGQSIPADLQAADQAWQSNRKASTPTPLRPAKLDENDQESGANEDSSTPATTSAGDNEDTYDSELASIYLLPVNPQGQIISNPNAYIPPLQPDPQAVAAAIANGRDFRTVIQGDGSRIRLFTYRVSAATGLAVLQVGRSLKDQDRLLSQLLVGLAILGGFSVLIIGAGSWWLAGRSLIPAQRAWDRQQAFVANASHELRTPLTLLRASAEVALRGTEAQDSRRELLADILNETDHMSHLVDDLLLLSRLDAGRLKLDLKPVDSAALLADLAREMGRVASRDNVTLDVINAQGVALADPTRLRQVLLILLDNALRHTPSGGAIRLEARAENRRVLWLVNDTGSGIAAHHLPHIFERFYRGEGDRRQPTAGSGLGLAIAKGLIEAMHGQIHIASQPGRGTQVTVSLPAVSSIKS